MPSIPLGVAVLTDVNKLLPADTLGAKSYLAYDFFVVDPALHAAVGFHLVDQPVTGALGNLKPRLAGKGTDTLYGGVPGGLPLNPQGGLIHDGVVAHLGVVVALQGLALLWGGEPLLGLEGRHGVLQGQGGRARHLGLELIIVVGKLTHIAFLRLSG